MFLTFNRFNLILATLNEYLIHEIKIWTICCFFFGYDYAFFRCTNENNHIISLSLVLTLKTTRSSTFDSNYKYFFSFHLELNGEHYEQSKGRRYTVTHWKFHSIEAYLSSVQFLCLKAKANCMCCLCRCVLPCCLTNTLAKSISTSVHASAI